MSSMSTTALGAFGLAGAQSLNVLGAYFPSWMLCGLLALAATAAVRWLFVRKKLDRSLPAPVFVYAAFIAVFSLGAWLLWLS
jgi:hypothetical protein